MLEKNRVDQLDRYCEKRNMIYSKGGQEYPTYNKKKEDGLDWPHFG
jgi:hypothetical protein